MNSVDLTPIEINDTEYRKLSLIVNDRFKCEWDDAVHDSYGLYVRQVQERAESLRGIRCKAEELNKEISALNIDALTARTEYLCREVDTV